MILNPCIRCGGRDVDKRSSNDWFLWFACHTCGNTSTGTYKDLDVAVGQWNDENPIEPATICPQCGATNRPVEWEEALDILRSAMQRKLTER
jgi:hypothetical protein